MRQDNDNAEGWCECVWDFPGHIDGALCKTCGHIIPGVEFLKSKNGFAVLTKHGKACNARRAIRVVK